MDVQEKVLISVSRLEALLEKESLWDSAVSATERYEGLKQHQEAVVDSFESDPVAE